MEDTGCGRDMHSVRQDLRFALRLFGKSRGFTAVALATLALTIGANATIFSLVDALFLRPLPVPDSHEVVHVPRTKAGSAEALFLSAIGLYGVLAFTVSHRTREIAVRMALGAASGHVARTVVRQSMLLAAIGVCLGIAVAAISARQIASLLYGVPQYDLVAFLGAPIALLAVALAASYLPARRATRVQPSVALRYD